MGSTLGAVTSRTCRGLGRLLLVAVALGSARQAMAAGTIYLNRCAGGCTVTPGPESSINDTSSVVSSMANLAAFAPTGDAGQDDALWADFVACFTRTWEGFDVLVTEVDPSPGNHHEVMVGGLPQSVGLPTGVRGAAPFDCSEIANSIAFVFPALHEIEGVLDVDLLCQTAASQAAATWGLEPVYWNADVMTYLGGCFPKSFSAHDSDCGALSPQACICGGTKQNSYLRLGSRAGYSSIVFRDDFEDDWDCNFTMVVGD